MIQVEDETQKVSATHHLASASLDLSLSMICFKVILHNISGGLLIHYLPCVRSDFIRSEE